MDGLMRCPYCGIKPDICYTAGMSKPLRDLLKNPIIGSRPRWYTKCKCGKALVAESKHADYISVQRAREALIKRWNEQCKAAWAQAEKERE